jgi:hypothetical protein
MKLMGGVSEPVVELVEGREGNWKTFALTNTGHYLVRDGSRDERIVVNDLIVIKGRLRECLSTGGFTKSGGEAETLLDGQVSLENCHGHVSLGLLRQDVATATAEQSVNSADGIRSGRDLNEEDGLHDSGLSNQLRTVHGTTDGGDGLTTATMNCVWVEAGIDEVEANAAHGLLTQNTFLGCPLETGTVKR